MHGVSQTIEELRGSQPARFEYRTEGGAYLNLKGAPLPSLPEIDEPKLAQLSRIVRGLIFAAVDGARSGHPGGSSSKVEQLMAMLACGVLGFDPLRPKHPGRDRIVWSAGHCSPLHHSLVSLVYESLRRGGGTLAEEARSAAVYPGELAKFRTFDGPSGHVESCYALADTSSGSSGHGFSAGLGFAVLHRSCGL
ncbi:MAG TPA: hypothetical protein VLH09_01835, partial [Bryobacteraceae bacterium]|nr:hypothetical protein [Bryobacteraceae bacterium]